MTADKGAWACAGVDPHHTRAARLPRTRDPPAHFVCRSHARTPTHTHTNTKSLSPHRSAAGEVVALLCSSYKFLQAWAEECDEAWAEDDDDAVRLGVTQGGCVQVMLS
jgi:hypothetical protein